MIPWVQLNSAKTPDGGQELRLKQRGSEFSIMLGTNELMNSRLSGSEEALARLVLRRIAGRTQPRILIGGLGMGFTLRAALAELGDDAGVIVAELVPAVVAWARGPMAAVFGGCLDDPRVTIREADVGAPDTARAARLGCHPARCRQWSGGDRPTRATTPSTARPGLAAARAALKPGGVLAVWSQGPDAGFSRRLRHAGFAVEEVKVRANGKRGARHVIWIAANGPRP